MPSSLIIVALVVAWLLVLVPIVARRRQEVARTADSTLAARVVRSGGVRSTAEEEFTMTEAGETDTTLEEDEYFPAEEDEDYTEYSEYSEYEDDDSGPRPYRPGRGGFDPEAAAFAARARYAFRQRVVVTTLMAALISGLVAGLLSPVVWSLHAAIDIGLVAYLGYLRRQVRIEEEIRERRTARLAVQRRAHTQPRPAHVEHDAHGPDLDDELVEAPLPARRPLARHVHPGAVVVDTDDEDPMFAELDEPGALPYRRAVGE